MSGDSKRAKYGSQSHMKKVKCTRDQLPIFYYKSTGWIELILISFTSVSAGSVATHRN